MRNGDRGQEAALESARGWGGSKGDAAFPSSVGDRAPVRHLDL